MLLVLYLDQMLNGQQELLDVVQGVGVRRVGHGLVFLDNKSLEVFTTSTWLTCMSMSLSPWSSLEWTHILPGEQRPLKGLKVVVVGGQG